MKVQQCKVPSKSGCQGFDTPSSVSVAVRCLPRVHVHVPLKDLLGAKVSTSEPS